MSCSISHTFLFSFLKVHLFSSQVKVQTVATWSGRFNGSNGPQAMMSSSWVELLLIPCTCPLSVNPCSKTGYNIFH